MLRKYLFLTLAVIASIQQCSSGSLGVPGSFSNSTLAGSTETTAMRVQELFTQGLVMADLMNSRTFSRSQVLGRLDTILEDRITNDFDFAKYVFAPDKIHIVFDIFGDLWRSICHCPWWCCCAGVDEHDAKLDELQNGVREVLQKGKTFYEFLQIACTDQLYADQFHLWRQKTEDHLRNIKRQVAAMDTRKKSKLEILREIVSMTSITSDTDIGQSIIQLRDAFYSLNKRSSRENICHQ
jgi:hypothetical protein